MEKQKNKYRKKKKIFLNRRKVKDNLMLGTLVLPGVILILLFGYLPMFGNVLAFKTYKVTEGILGSPWAEPWYTNFRFFFESNTAWRTVRNTLGLNFLFIAVGLICNMIFALLMYEVKKAVHVKTYQTFAILPSFLSWVVVGYIVYALLNSNGVINSMIEALGGAGVSWYSEPEYWPVILMIVNVWHGTGLASILYYAALMGVDQGLFDAAAIDGASKIKQIIHISLPSLVPIMTITTLLNIGSIFRADFGLFYNVTRNVGVLYSTTDVMDTYIYRALMEVGNIQMSSAASFIQSVVCCVTLLVANAAARKINPENALF